MLLGSSKLVSSHVYTQFPPWGFALFSPKISARPNKQSITQLIFDAKIPNKFKGYIYLIFFTKGCPLSGFLAYTLLLMVISGLISKECIFKWLQWWPVLERTAESRSTLKGVFLAPARKKSWLMARIPSIYHIIRAFWTFWPTSLLEGLLFGAE